MWPQGSCSRQARSCCGSATQPCCTLSRFAVGFLFAAVLAVHADDTDDASWLVGPEHSAQFLAAAKAAAAGASESKDSAHGEANDGKGQASAQPKTQSEAKDEERGAQPKTQSEAKDSERGEARDEAAEKKADELWFASARGDAKGQQSAGPQQVASANPSVASEDPPVDKLSVNPPVVNSEAQGKANGHQGDKLSVASEPPSAVDSDAQDKARGRKADKAEVSVATADASSASKEAKGKSQKQRPDKAEVSAASEGGTDTNTDTDTGASSGSKEAKGKSEERQADKAESEAASDGASSGNGGAKGKAEDRQADKAEISVASEDASSDKREAKAKAEGRQSNSAEVLVTSEDVPSANSAAKVKSEGRQADDDERLAKGEASSLPAVATTTSQPAPNLLVGAPQIAMPTTAAAPAPPSVPGGLDDFFHKLHSLLQPAQVKDEGTKVEEDEASWMSHAKADLKQALKVEKELKLQALKDKLKTLKDEETKELDIHQSEADDKLEDSATGAGNVDGAGPFAYHKDLLPLNKLDWATLGCSALALILAAGGGIGGGGVLVPLFMLLWKFRPKHAIALSNLTIFGGSIANTLFNVQKKRPDGRALIDWDIIVMMEPSTITGAVLGSFASKYLPDFVLTVSLSIVLGMLSYRTMEKGISMFKKETQEQQGLEVKTKGTETELAKLGPVDEEESERLMPPSSTVRAPPRLDTSTPWCKIYMIILCSIGCMVLTILKGSAHGSIIGIECGSRAFWMLSLGSIPWTIAFGAVFRCMLMSEHEAKVQAKHRFQDDDILWDGDSTIRYPLICTLAGVFAGLFGVGGGIVKGPLMLEMGVNPLVASATAAQMILFTTSAACVSFEVFGLLEPWYGFLCFVTGIACTAIGQAGINAYMKSAKRHSPPVLSIGAIMVASTFLVFLEAIKKFTEKDMDELFRTSSLCSKNS